MRAQTAARRSRLRPSKVSVSTSCIASARSFDLVRLFWRRWKTLLGVTVLGAVIGAAASFLITPRYKSEVILFPAITNTASKALLNEGASNSADMMMMGEEGGGRVGPVCGVGMEWIRWEGCRWMH